jgi:hypothetical protein
LEILLDRPCLQCGAPKIARGGCPHAVVTNRYAVVSTHQWNTINADLRRLRAEVDRLSALEAGLVDPSIIDQLAPHAKPLIKEIGSDGIPGFIMLNNDEIVRNVMTALLRMLGPKPKERKP